MIVRFFVWLGRRAGLYTLLTIGLALVGLLAVALGLADTVRGLDRLLVGTIAIASVLTGWLLAASSIGPWTACFAAIASGAPLVLVSAGGLRGSLLKLLRPWNVPGADHPLRAFAADLAALLVRVGDWLAALLTGEPGYDPVASVLSWCIVLWGTGCWASWSLRRRQAPLQAMLPAGALLAATLSYAGGNAWYTMLLLAALLLLLVLVGHRRRERRWEAGGVDYSLDLRPDVAVAALPLATVLIVTAALVPSISVRAIARSAQRLLVGRMEQVQPVVGSFGLEPQPQPASLFDTVDSVGLPRRHLIGSGPELSEELVMTIEVEELEGASAALLTNPRWRALTYNRYSGRGWSTGSTDTIS
ncbi:MAG: hypothetical protein ACRDIB_08130, partial [Ardenticatenaceae bacterium]